MTRKTVSTEEGIVTYVVKESNQDDSGRVWYGGEIVESSDPTFDEGNWFEALADEWEEN